MEQDVAPAADSPPDGADAPCVPRYGTRRPRVLHVITKLDLGGAESVAMELVGALRQRVDFAVFGVFRLDSPSSVGRDMAARLAAWNVPFFDGTAGHFKKGGVLVAAHRLARAIARFRPDIVHLHTEVPELTFAVATLLSRRAAKAGVLRTVHNCELWIDWAGIGRWVTDRLAGGDAVAVSHAAADADLAIPTHARRNRAGVIHNGVTPPPVVAGPVGDRPFRLLFAGRFVPQKGTDLLPGILRIAHGAAARRDVSVTIAGTGPLAETLEQGLRGVAPGWMIDIIPPVDRLTERLGEYDAVLMPSRFEGLPLLAIEVLMAGLPLVTTNAPGLAEVLPPGYPMQAPVDDVAALGTLLAGVIDRPAQARAAVGGLREMLCTRFSPATMADAYAARYAALIGEPAA